MTQITMIIDSEVDTLLSKFIKELSDTYDYYRNGRVTNTSSEFYMYNMGIAIGIMHGAKLVLTENEYGKYIDFAKRNSPLGENK